MKHRLNIEKLAKEAYEIGRKAAFKAAKKYGYDNQWNDIPEAARVGYIAMTKHILKKVRKPL